LNALIKAIGRVFGEPETGKREPAEETMARAVAALLIEGAKVDGQYGDAEFRLIERLVGARFGLSDDRLARVLDRAANDVERTTQLFGFTSDIVAGCTPDERAEVVRMLWDVAHVDGTVHDYEAALIRRICGLLHVTDRDSGAARKQAAAGLKARTTNHRGKHQP